MAILFVGSVGVGSCGAWHRAVAPVVTFRGSARTSIRPRIPWDMTGAAPGKKDAGQIARGAKEALESVVLSAESQLKPDPFALACPNSKGVTGLEESSADGTTLCVECGAEFGTYRRDEPAVRDFVLGSRMTQGQAGRRPSPSLQESLERAVNRVLAPPPSRQELFRNPIVSFLYERGWRDNFARAGFPGPDEELSLALEWFHNSSAAGPADFAQKVAGQEGKRRLGGTVLDVSCGSGLMTRRLVLSDQFDRVVAVDYSESMLRETVRRAREARLPVRTTQGTKRAERRRQGRSSSAIPDSDVELGFIRADVARLPFADESVRFIHNGAALHCYPVVQDAVREFYRVLQPGGALFATTFLRKGMYAKMPGGRGAMRTFDQDELKYLFIAGGFEDVQVEPLRGCAVIRALKLFHE
ncbi:putative methyltransferase, chloroplastic [Porphyridium purpureum]|uniref:Putative methyltransferase, chloroplastic n=1 Tax=Porphyridium purpureum TaxID=35688 RepID=A0A5J4YZE8_PORPP|nr:putative methyltransferase, chloroplastic [Porphyridium purpureum]|eukprot:POR6158..scf208_2